MSKINRNGKRKLGSKILLSSLSVPAIVSSVQQSNANAGWFSGITSLANNAYEGTKKGISKLLSGANKAYNDTKEIVSKNYNQAKKITSKAYTKVKNNINYFLYTDQDTINADKKNKNQKNLSALGEFVADTIKGSYGIYKHAKNIFTGNEDENLGLTNKESWESFIYNLAAQNLSKVSFFMYGNELTISKNNANSVKISKDEKNNIEIKYNEENKTLKCTLTRDQETSQINDAKTLMKEIKKILKETNPRIKVYTEAYNNNPKSLKDIKFSKYDKATKEEWRNFVNKLEEGGKVFTDSLHDANGQFSSTNKNTVWFKLTNGNSSGIGLTYLSNGKIMIAREDEEKYQEGKGIPLTWSVSEDFDDLKYRLSIAFNGKHMNIKLQENTSAPVTSLDDIFSNTTQSSTNKI